MTRPKLLFVATEDWFVRSHFMPMVRRSVEQGFDTIVAARMGEAQAELRDAGARTIDLADARGVYSIDALTKAARNLRRTLREERPDIVHAIALRPILLACLAAIGAPPAAHVFAVTGRGYLSTRSSWRMRQALNLVAWLIARRVRAGKAVLLIENDEDRAWVAGRGGLPLSQVVRAPGAGVELARYPVAPEPGAPPIRIGFVSRLVRTKGADIAVEALRQLNAEGLDLRLAIAGAPDPENPGAVSQAEIEAWGEVQGVEIVGKIDDVAGFWADKHIACLPSRGGEGLPRSLLEAAACARPIVTTNVPGCADFVSHNLTGLIVRREDPADLAKALKRLATDADLRQRLGQAARERVAAGFTTRHAADSAAEAWRIALARDA